MGEVIALASSDSGTAADHQQSCGWGMSSGLVVVLPCLLALGVVLAACAPASETTAAATAPSTAASSIAPSPNPSTSTSQPAPNAESVMQACTPDVADAAFDVVQRQQRALAEDDFAAALLFASTGFRSSVTLPQFKALIVSGYGFLLSTPRLRLAECRAFETAAVLRVSAGSNSVLAYRMVAEGGQWRIDGASILKEISA